MFAFGSLLLVLLLSLLIIRTGAIMLEFTGVSPDVARFQARSAFSGTGYTTKECELIVNHPVRRRIVASLMTVGSIGIPTTLATAVISVMSSTNSTDGLLALALTVAIFFALIYVSRARIVDRTLHRIISWALRRWTKIEVEDYQSLLEVERGYRVARVRVRENTWLAQGATLRELRLAQSGVLVLGIHREEEYIGAPQAEFIVEPGDELLCYGSSLVLDELRERPLGPDGDEAHFAAIQHHVRTQAQDSIIIERTSLREPEAGDEEALAANTGKR